jgi:hypothetical protein
MLVYKGFSDSCSQIADIFADLRADLFADQQGPHSANQHAWVSVGQS